MIVWLPVVVLLGVAVVLVVSMVRGGGLGERWYTGGRSRLDRDRESRPDEPTRNIRTRQWGGTTPDE